MSEKSKTLAAKLTCRRCLGRRYVKEICYRKGGSLRKDAFCRTCKKDLGILEIKPKKLSKKYLFTKKWRQSHPEKYKAHTKLNWAIRRGIKTKLPCIICGEVKVDAHHEDYSKPLEVVWLCRFHHQELHFRRNI